MLNIHHFREEHGRQPESTDIKPSDYRFLSPFLDSESGLNLDKGIISSMEKAAIKSVILIPSSEQKTSLSSVKVFDGKEGKPVSVIFAYISDTSSLAKKLERDFYRNN